MRYDLNNNFNTIFNLFKKKIKIYIAIQLSFVNHINLVLLFENWRNLMF